jgi:hypothetical protein
MERGYELDMMCLLGDFDRDLMLVIQRKQYPIEIVHTPKTEQNRFGEAFISIKGKFHCKCGLGYRKLTILSQI